jgi:hypothetical protein
MPALQSGILPRNNQRVLKDAWFEFGIRDVPIICKLGEARKFPMRYHLSLLLGDQGDTFLS